MSDRVIGAPLQDRYEQLSFSGGGLRCFWQGGALDALRQECDIAAERIAAASGGALSAACFVADCGTRLIEAFCDRLERHDHNFEPELSTDPTDLTPHQAIYRDVVSAVLDDEACEAVANGPAFEVLLARLPRWLPRKAGAAMTMAAYEIDKHMRSTPHGRYAEALGARELRVDGRQAARDGRLVELVCQAATIPPVFRMREWDGKPVIDAGTIDNAPLPDGDDGRTLVLLTRSYRNLPQVAGRTYLCPSHATPADKIDFTDAEALRATYWQGRRDIEDLLARRGGSRTRDT